MDRGPIERPHLVENYKVKRPTVKMDESQTPNKLAVLESESGRMKLKFCFYNLYSINSMI